MCIPGLDPLTLLGVIGGVGSAAAGLVSAAADPPEAAVPFTPPLKEDAGAKIKIGTQDGPDDGNGGSGFVSTDLRRTSGRTIGGLGRGGLAL